MNPFRLGSFAATCVLASLCQLGGLGSLATAAERAPTFEQVVAAAAAYFKTLPDHQPNDLISQSNVAGALTAIDQAGWEVPYPDKIKRLALADDSFLVKELATNEGKSFMRKIARCRGAYARLDRLSQINEGQDAVETLIKDPGGDTMIRYMATTQGGHELGKMMSGVPHGTDLNKPTGRLYTANDLILLLRQIYEIEFSSRR